MFFFRFSRQLCTRALSSHFFRALCVPNLVLFSDCFPELSVFSVTKMKSDIVCARAQAAILRLSGHSVKEIAKFFNKTVRWVFNKTVRWVEKRVLRRQTKKRTTVCFDQCCSKINRESEVQKEQFNKEDCQESSAEKYGGSFEHNGEDMTRKGWKAFKRKKIPLLSEKQRKACLRFAKKHAKLTAEDWDNFLFTDECPKYLFQYPNPKYDIVWGSQECDVPPAFQVKQSAKVMCGVV